MQSNDYVFITRWQVEGKADGAYQILTDVPGYLRWWSDVYLAVEKTTPAAHDGLGETHRLLTRGKLPYRLRWSARIIETRRPTAFTIEATGDFVGRGVWSFDERAKHLDITFDWRLRAEKPLLKSLSFLLKPLFRWNHRWAMTRGRMACDVSSFVAERPVEGKRLKGRRKYPRTQYSEAIDCRA